MGAQAKASQQQGTLVHRELHKQAYNEALVQRYQHLPDVKRIQRHRHLPTPLYKVRCACAYTFPYAVTASGLPEIGNMTPYRHCSLWWSLSNTGAAL